VERAAEMPVVATDLEAQRTAVETVEAGSMSPVRTSHGILMASSFNRT
jgi:hypothetical protein